MMLQAETVIELFCRRIEASGGEDALAVKREGQYRWQTWNDVAGDVARAVAGLVHLGVQPGDRVGQVAENRQEWIIADLAMQMAGAVHVPIHPTLAGPQIAWQIKHCTPKVVLLSGPGQAAKLAALGKECPVGPRWTSYDRCEESLSGPRPIEVLKELQAAGGRCTEGTEAACQTRSGRRLAIWRRFFTRRARRASRRG